MIVCARCGQQNPDAAVLCLHCGNELPRGGTTLPIGPSEDAMTAPPIGPPQPAGAPFSPGDLIDGKYRVERVLGEGGMGIVFLATDVNTETHVVVKALHAQLARSEEFRGRVRQEARALARIDHPNVVRLNAVVANEGVLLLVMQFVDGESLDKLIARHVQENQPIPLGEALSLFRQIALGVGAAHAEGVVHRDIKPANVLLRSRDHVAKVTDFGIAKAEEDAKAGRGQTKGIIGSLWYMAPEQVTGDHHLDKRVDVYALGILLFELLVGRVPFDGATDYEIMKAITSQPTPSVHAIRADVPEAIDALLARATAKDRDARFASTDELVSALDAITGDSRPPPSMQWAPPSAHWAPPPSNAMPMPAPTIETTPETEPARSRTPLVAGILAVLVVLSGVGFVVLRSNGGPVTAASASAPNPSSSAPTITPVTTPFEDLPGRWVSDTGHHYDAVPAGDSLEFRVRDPAEFPGQNYLAGEPRFTLRLTSHARSYAVEDKIRPTPPSGYAVDPRARGTCQEVWTDVKGTPLHASYDGARLTVDMAKVTPKESAFVTQRTNGKTTVVGCSRLTESAVDRVESTLTRE